MWSLDMVTRVYRLDSSGRGRAGRAGLPGQDAVPFMQRAVRCGPTSRTQYKRQDAF